MLDGSGDIEVTGIAYDSRRVKPGDLFVAVPGLHVDGHVAGGVRSDEAPDATLSVSATGSIEGPVQVPNVVLDGMVKGDIYARERVVLGATARVEGNVYYGIIEMTLGAQIIGKLVRLEPETPPGAPATGSTA